MTTKVVSLRVGVDTFSLLEGLAEDKSRSSSDIVRDAIVLYVLAQYGIKEALGVKDALAKDMEGTSTGEYLRQTIDDLEFSVRESKKYVENLETLLSRLSEWYERLKSSEDEVRQEMLESMRIREENKT